MPQKLSPTQLKAHFIGIGGIGISALARWFLAKKWAISGSDIAKSLITAELRKEGVRVKISHKKANLLSRVPDMVIYSAAVRPDNPELRQARLLGIKPLSYPKAVGCLTPVYRTIAIAGSHGKSTTTALVGLALIKAGFDPTVIIGTNLKEFGGKNFRAGKSRWLVLEADEWRASFLNYSSEFAIVTNIDKEHLDFYKNLGNIKKTFLKFLAKVKDGGVLILNRDDKNLYSLHSPITKLAERRNLKVFWYSANKIRNPKSEIRNLRKVLKISGEHNLSNAMAAITLAKILKIKKSVALKALSQYRGAWRRMEYRGEIKNKKSKIKIKVYDDYAHHPTEIKATLQAFREKFPKSKIICVYQPHQAKRLKALFKEFINAFALADVLVLLPVYEVAGRDKVSSSFTSKKLAAAIRKKYPLKEVYYLPNPKSIKKIVSKTLLAKPHTPSSLRLSEPNGLSPILVMMGAGDISNFTPFLTK